MRLLYPSSVLISIYIFGTLLLPVDSFFAKSSIPKTWNTGARCNDCLPTDSFRENFILKATGKDDSGGTSRRNEREAPKLDFNENLYDIIEVSADASPEELKKAYYKVVFKYHPDNKESDSDKELCNRQMMVINHAYKILKDPDSRADYDKKMGISKAKRRVDSEPRSQPKQRNPENDQKFSSQPTEPFSASEEFQSVTGSKFKKMMEEMYSKSPELKEKMSAEASKKYGPQSRQTTDRQETFSKSYGIEDEVDELLYQFGDGSVEGLRVSYLICPQFSFDLLAVISA
jgi:curved DNA-binding protein CbpA